MNRIGLPTILAPALAAFAMLPPVSVSALEIDAQVFHEALYTSNTARTETDELEEMINTPGITLAASQAGTQVELTADYQFQRRIYEEDLFQDENVTTGAAEMIWHVLPSRLDFTLRNTRSESTERALEPLTQDNRQTVSITELGPTLRMSPRSGDELQIEYLYSDVSAEDTDTDSIRHDSTMRYIVGLSESRALTFSAENNQTQFDNPSAPDLDGWTGMATLAQTADLFSYALGAGYTTVSRTDDRDDVEGAVFAVSLERQLPSSFSINFSASRAIRDQSENLYSGATEPGSEITENTDLNEVFTESLAALEIGRPLGNNEVGLRLDVTTQDYEDVGRDNERWLVSMRLTRNLTELTTLSADIGTGTSEFEDEGSDYDDLRGSVMVAWQLSPRFNLVWGARYEERDGGDAATGNYEEWIGSARLSYLLLGVSRP